MSNRVKHYPILAHNPARFRHMLSKIRSDHVANSIEANPEQYLACDPAAVPRQYCSLSILRFLKFFLQHLQGLFCYKCNHLL